VTKTLRNRVVVRSQYFIENLIEAVGGYSVLVGWSVFTSGKNNFILKTRRAISCAVNFYNAGVVTQNRRIGSKVKLKAFVLVQLNLRILSIMI
jgi:hypothetical protein